MRSDENELKLCGGVVCLIDSLIRLYMHDTSGYECLLTWQLIVTKFPLTKSSLFTCGELASFSTGLCIGRTRYRLHTCVLCMLIACSASHNTDTYAINFQCFLKSLLNAANENFQMIYIYIECLGERLISTYL